MSLTVFYSWQSDSPKETNRSFIQSALEKVVRRLGQDAELHPALRDEEVVLDRDTAGVPGTPPIVDTILNKISNCSVFVPDLTFVGHTEAGKPIPNPNVLIEYGWALKVLGYTSIVPLMNTAFGEPNAKTLPFDMRHLRHPLTYHLGVTDDPATKARVKKDLIDKLTEYVGLAIRARLASTPSPIPFEGAPFTENPSTFLKKGETFTSGGRFGSHNQELILPSTQRLFLRLIPHSPLMTIRSSQMALEFVQSGGLRPMTDGSLQGISYGRNRYGAFSYDQSEGKILYMSQLLKTGELWGINSFMINAEHIKQFASTNFAYFSTTSVEEAFAFTLTNYLKFARETLRLEPPLRFKAGATDVKGYRMGVHSFDRYAGNVVDQHIVYDEGTIDDRDGQAIALLRPFFDYFWEECGLKRPDVEIYR